MQNQTGWCGQYHEISHGHVTTILYSHWLTLSKYMMIHSIIIFPFSIYTYFLTSNVSIFKIVHWQYNKATIGYHPMENAKCCISCKWILISVIAAVNIHFQPMQYFSILQRMTNNICMVNAHQMTDWLISITLYRIVSAVYPKDSPVEARFIET